MRALGMRDLDRLTSRGCVVPGCRHAPNAVRTPLYLHSRCHPRKPWWLTYVGGILVAECSGCRRVVLRVRPAIDGETLSDSVRDSGPDS